MLNVAGVERRFPWTKSYQWSRQSNFYAMSSALQAMEAWAHRRLDAGEPFEAVLADVLGPPGSCAAYVLVAVDLLLSHWPASRDSALPFLSSPELLSLDVERAALDPLAADGGEPQGEVSAAELRKRLSRRTRLSGLIGKFMSSAEIVRGQQLIDALSAATLRLGPYSPSHTLGSPPFMVRHALNLAEKANWKTVEVTLRDGTKVLEPQYVSPTEEEAHFSGLRRARAEENQNLNIRLVLDQVLRSSARLSAEQLESAIQWARSPERDPSVTAANADVAAKDSRMAALTVAFLVVRDAEADLREPNAEWASACFDEALNDPNPDGVLQIREGLSYNPLATSFAGRLLALRFRRAPEAIRSVLIVAARGMHEAAHGLGAAIDAVVAIDPRLVKALVRCALHGCTSSRLRWNTTPEKEAELKAERDRLVQQVVDGELRWLTDAGSEPAWPMPPRREPHSRSGLRLPMPAAADEEPITLEDALSTKDDEFAAPLDLFDEEVELDPPWFNSQSAALWLRQLSGAPLEGLPWLSEMVEAYMSWTMTANGAEMADGEEASDAPGEWNQVFFDFLARTLPESDVERALRLINSLFKLGDQNFFELTGIFTRALDENYFGEASRPSTAVAVSIREALADHLITTWGWRRAQGRHDRFNERYLSMAVAGMFFNSRSGFAPSSCYLKALHIDRLSAFLPVLHKLVDAGPSYKVADVLLNLLEVSPRPEHLPLLALACRRWLEAFAGFPVFWVDFGMGGRWCKVVQAAVGGGDGLRDTSFPADLPHLVAELIALGVPEAPRLETTLAAR